MLDVTNAAASHLHDLLGKAKADTQVQDDASIRLRMTDEGSLGFVLDKERPGDKTIAYEGETVLVCEMNISQELSGQTLDVVDTGHGKAFALK